MNTTDTPETDSLIAEWMLGGKFPNYAEFARKLELERNEAKTKFEQVSSKLSEALKERDDAIKLSKQMSESNVVLLAEVRNYRNNDKPIYNNESHLKLVLEEVAKMAKELKKERDEAREQNAKLRNLAEKVIGSLSWFHDVSARIHRAELDQLNDASK